MTIETKKNGTELIISLTGRLDTSTAPQLDATLKDSYAGLTSLIFDLAGLDYISSAGLRALLAAQKQMNKQGTMKVRHVNDAVMEVFEITAFVDLLTIEK